MKTHQPQNSSLSRNFGRAERLRSAALFLLSCALLAGLAPPAAQAQSVQVPAAPAKPTFGLKTISSLQVLWQAPDDRGAAIKEYRYRYRLRWGTHRPWSTHVLRSGTLTSTYLIRLRNATTYQVQVRAVNSKGPGPWSPSAEAKTDDKEGPPALSKAEVNGDELVLTYDELLDTTSVPFGIGFVVSAVPIVAAGWTEPEVWVLSAAVSGRAVTLELFPEVTHEQTVTLSYSPDDDVFPIRDFGHNAAGALTAYEVTNKTPLTIATTDRYNFLTLPENNCDLTNRVANDCTYGRGEVIEIAADFDQAVTVTGSPRLALTIGNATRQATYIDSTERSLWFGYTVQSATRTRTGSASPQAPCRSTAGPSWTPTPAAPRS